MPDSGDALDRRVALMVAAVSRALVGIGSLGDRRVGVFIGAESGLARFHHALDLSRAAGGGEAFDHDAFASAGPELLGSVEQAQTSPSAPTWAVAAALGATGPIETISLACASSSVAVAHARRALLQGECDVAVCGGVGADVDALMLAAFARLGALSEHGVSRPFDAHRDGFVLGEGAAAIVLSGERGDARAEIAGAGMTLDAHHLTAPEPTGAGAVRAMTAALNEAGVDAVDYVQAHGTSTPAGDAIEAAAIARLFGEDTPVASVKGALGHWIAGAGALGIACAHEAVVSGRLLPTAGLERVDEECALDHVVGRARMADARVALSNAFGFGGANCSVVVRRCDA
jgi:3-oxoacyl-[acyl-carrier-protein] synthase II